MHEYPREDKPLDVCLADGTRLSGLVNIAGRTARDVLEDAETDMVLYDSRQGDGMPLQTVLIPKNQILWVAPAGEPGQTKESGSLKQVRFKLANGLLITGRVDAGGFERISDYFQACRDRFYEIRDASLNDGAYAVMYVGARQVLWKQPVD
jgi:hypothetical protein